MEIRLEEGREEKKEIGEDLCLILKNLNFWCFINILIDGNFKNYFFYYCFNVCFFLIFSEYMCFIFLVFI